MYTILKEKVSRVYGTPPSERLKRIYNTSPSKFETIDQVWDLLIIIFISCLCSRRAMEITANQEFVLFF